VSGESDYPAIADHGVIGDLRTAALVARDGTIDFLCLPEFDSPTVFARLLDADRGGSFCVALTVGDLRHEQRYVRDTNVLVTRLIGTDRELEVIDFMPVPRATAPSTIVRLARMVRGDGTVRCQCAPRFGYARETHEVSMGGGGALFTVADGPALRLTTRAPMHIVGGDVVAECALRVGQQVAFVLEVMPSRERARVATDRWAARTLRRTIVFWRRWIGKSKYQGTSGTVLRRSALALKLLQSRRTGAFVAAPTFALPEQVGGTRNWDFRYAWIRDTSFTIFALGRLGLWTEARAFSSWLVERCEEAPSPGELQSLYGIDGRRELAEQLLDHLEGYRRSRPVRIGNAAYDQLQLDSYGELLDALYQRDKHVEPTSRALWRRIVELTDWVCRNWERPDQGIWEVRGGGQHFLYSRVMCWVAVDRALRIAARRRLRAPREEWRRIRDIIRTDVHEHFWNESLGSFVGARDTEAIDAACLVMPMVGFITPTDPRWLSTLRVVEARLVRDALVRRYDMTGMDTDAGSLTAPSFTICSFWYVECLALAGEIDKARSAMTRLLGLANHLGLYAEDLGPTGDQLGNFPQGLVHAGLISAGVALASADG
jgi:GH15 family glucan-1,4-alpha-glucosidase